MIGSQVDFPASACATRWSLLSTAASIAASSASTSSIASPIILRGSLGRLGFTGKRCGLSRSLRWTILRISLVWLCLHHHCGPATVSLGLAISLSFLFGLLSLLIISWTFGCLWSRSLRLFLRGSRIGVIRFFGGLRSLLILILILWARTFCLLLACRLLLGSLVEALLVVIIFLLLLVLLLATAWVVVLHTCLVGYDDRFRCLLWFTF